MEATDLMVGDIVKLDDQIMEIAAICGKTGVILDSRYRQTDKYGYYLASKVKPIPLTEDLLKTNGWVYDEEQFSWYNCRLHNTHGLSLFIYADDNAGQFFFCDYITIDSVHELQHCLRLAGQKDLADNFKVERV